jgi:hypothetical protein
MKLLFDEHFSDDLAAAVRHGRPALKVSTVHERELDGLDDIPLLEILDEEKTVLVTRDVRTIRGALAERLSSGLTHGGVIFVPRSIRQSDEKEMLRRLLKLLDATGGQDWRCREEWI